MPLSSSVTPIRAFAQVKFPTNFLFIDKRGEIADFASKRYTDNIQISDMVAAGSEGDNALFRATENNFWVAKKTSTRDEAIDLDSFISWATDQFVFLAGLLKITGFMTVGLRVYYMEDFLSVAEAIEAYKERLINYSLSPYSDIVGTPTKCIIEFGAKEGSINRNFKITSIHDEREDAPADSGGILFDFDTNHDNREELVSLENCHSIYATLKDTSVETINIFVNAINGGNQEGTKAVQA